MRPSQRTLLAAAIVVLTATACGRGGGGAGKGPGQPLVVDVAQAQRQNIATFVTLDGQIAPVQESTLSSQQSGNVAAVYVNKGQHVRRGQVVAKLDDSTLRASLAQQQAVVQQQAAQLGSSTLQGPLTVAQAQVRLLETEIAQTSIVAPFDGVVTQRLLDPGAFASPNQPVVRVSQ